MVIIAFGISRRDVFIAPQAAEAPCIRAVLLSHEERHARIMDVAAHAFIQRHRERLARFLEEAKHRPAADGVSAARTFEAELLALLQRLSDEFTESAVGPLRLSGDSSGELARLRSACGGALGDMEKAVNTGRS